jgi:hypothetical protein
MLLTLVLVKLRERFHWLTTITDALMKKLFFNSLLRYAIQSYMKYCEACFSSFQDIGFDSAERTVNLPVALVALLFVVGYPAFTFYFMRNKVPANKGNADFVARYSSLFFTLKIEAYLAIYQTTMFLVRRLLLVAAVVFSKRAQYL